jgi:hypothetical protein
VPQRGKQYGTTVWISAVVPYSLYRSGLKNIERSKLPYRGKNKPGFQQSVKKSDPSGQEDSTLGADRDFQKSVIVVAILIAPTFLFHDLRHSK